MIFPRCVAVLCALLFLASSLNAQEEWQELSAVPQRLSIVKDQAGFSWQLTGAGSFYNMGSNSFKSANQLSVNGERFSADKARSIDETRFAFEKDFGDYQIIRDVWMDLERSGARHYDTFVNKTDDPLNLQITLESDFSYSWENLHSSSGKIIGTELSSRDAGVLVKFDARDGQSDVFFLISGERSPVRAKLSTDNNNRKVEFAFKVTVPPQGKKSICHWIGQRAVADIEEIKQTFTPFYQRRHLVRPRVPEDQNLQQLANFEVHDSSAPAAKPYDPDALIALNRLLDTLNIERGGDDLLWVSESNQLTGEVFTAEDLRFQSAVGTVTLGLGELAALRGGGGNGRMHEAFTRDGELYAGEMILSDAKMKGPDGWQMDLEAFSLETLLFRVEEEDGKLAERVWAFAELDTGDVLGLTGGMDSSIPFSTPWGTLLVELGEIIELAPVPIPTPRHRLQLSDGCQLTGFLMHEGELNLSTTRLDPFALNASGAALRGLWRKDSYQVTQDWQEDFETDWVESDVTSHTLVWLEGSNRLAAEIQGKHLNLLAGKTVTPISPQDIASLRRTEEGILDRIPLFEVELKNGDLLTGQIRERALTLSVRGNQWEVPTLHLLGFRQGDQP